MVPLDDVRGEPAPAAVLASARPIDHVEVRSVQRDGDLVSIDV
jgi:hypothetical protein